MEFAGFETGLRRDGLIGKMSTDNTATKKRYVRAVGPGLRKVLFLIFGLFALLFANSAYLGTITFLEWSQGVVLQNYFYQLMFLAHLVLGVLLILPVVVFGVLHMRNTWTRTNRRAVYVGLTLWIVSLILLATGVVLMRLGDFRLQGSPRTFAYWAHVITPFAVVWLYILHRMAGPKIKWRIGLSWTAATAAVVLGMVFLHKHDPRRKAAAPKEGAKYFEPSLARTTSGKFIPAETLMMDDYCKKCHADAYKGWFHSAHHFSSFNNQPYLFSIRETRKVSMQRDGNVKAARWCAGCHDVVPFLSGAFDDPNFDDVNHPTSQAGITCTSCHAITHVNSTKGNADYVMDEPVHYPFAYSTNSILQFVNQQLVKAKPDFHKKTFLKPVMKSAEFCSTCHKVSLPYEVTKYKEWLRGQNHYDTYLLSGVSGHNARSFYYPPAATTNCAGCHMPLMASKDFGAQYFNPTNSNRTIHDHLFPGANTALPHLRGDQEIVKRQQEFLKGSVRVDIFGVKEGGTIDSPLSAPIRPSVPKLKPGKKYLIESVVRTVRMGHPFTQGTVDSNEVWVDAQIASNGRTIGRSGGLGPYNQVDPWSHFINVFMLDKDGNRIDRRNAQDIFTPLYNHQIPPGAAQIVHYSLEVPENQRGPLTVEVKLNYRKFDTTYLHYVFGEKHTNDLPITTIASDKVVFPVEGSDAVVTNEPSKIDLWQRWNDYGIGLLLEGDKGSEKGELVQAAEAFGEVEKLKRPDGPLNLARVYLKEGRLEDAVAALQRASAFDPPAPRWTIAWLTGMVNKQNGYLDEAIKQFRSILEDQYEDLQKRKFDFSKDYEVINELGQTYFERAKAERGPANKQRQEQFLELAKERFFKTLELDSENLAAHYNLSLIFAQLGDEKLAAEHRRFHEKYRPDDNARDKAVAVMRRKNAAADHAAQAIVIYPLHRKEAFGLTTPPAPATAPIQTARIP